MPRRATSIAAFLLFASMVHSASEPAAPREKWRYARYEEFEVLSQLGDGPTARQVRAIAAVRRMVDFSTGFESRYAQPCLLIFLQDKPKYLEYLPAGDEVLAERTARPSAVNARKFLRGTEQTALVHLGDVYDNPYSRGALIIHNIFQQVSPRPPVWFRIGVGNLIRFADPEQTWDPARFFRDSLQVLPPTRDLLNAPLPPPEGLALDATPAGLGSPHAIFHHHAALFVHYGLFADGGRHRDALLTFVRMTGETPNAPADEPAFRACFGVGFDDMRTTLRDYMASPALKAVDLLAERKKQIATLPAVELRDATPGQIGRIKGEAKLMAGYGEDARREFAAAIANGGDRDPELLGAFGVLESVRKSNASAQRMLATASAASVARPMVHLQLARLLYPEVRAAADTRGKISRAQAAPVLTPLLKARALKPPSADVYQCLVVLFADLAEPMTQVEFAIVDEAVRLFPRDVDMVFAAAKLMRDQGDAIGAARLVDHGIKAATSDSNRARFERLKATLVVTTETAR